MKKTTAVLALALAAVLALAACGGGEPKQAEPTAPPAAPGGTGTIAGISTYANGDPDAPIDMNADPVCLSLHKDKVHTEKVVTDDSGNLANVFVYIKDAPPGRYAAKGSALLDQKGCQYFPHVSGVMVGQEIVIRNSDDTLHNVHALPTVNAEFNEGQPFAGMQTTKKFTKPEVMVRFKCDVHPWMSSYMGVLEHPFFGVSGGDGSFSIGNVPAGTYTVEAWHEELGTRTQSVTLGEGETVQVSFDFAAAG